MKFCNLNFFKYLPYFQVFAKFLVAIKPLSTFVSGLMCLFKWISLAFSVRVSAFISILFTLSDYFSFSKLLRLSFDWLCSVDLPVVFSFSFFKKKIPWIVF